METERTLCIIKPDAVEKNRIGAILGMLEADGFKIRGMQYMQLTRDRAEGFYAVHKERPFFKELVTFMTRGPVVVAVLERADAVTRYRALMGDTDSQKAAPGTIRSLHGKDKGENAVHGSDSAENAKNEIAFFFPNL